MGDKFGPIYETIGILCLFMVAVLLCIVIVSTVIQVHELHDNILLICDVLDLPCEGAKE